MFKNYIIIAFRHLTRHKFFSLINIFGLVVGITFSIVIGTYVLDEARVNSDIRNIASQYIIKSKWKQENIGLDFTTLGPLAKTMKDEYPQLVANYYRFDPVGNIVSVGDKHFRTQISVGDTTLVSMYGFQLAYGNPQHAFRNNKSAVVTEDFAKKFFDTPDVIDKVITIQTPADGLKHDFVITAVLKNMRRNTITNFTALPYQVYLPMNANEYFQGGDKGDNWANIFMVNMIELRKGVTVKDLEQPLAHILEKYQPDFVKGNLQLEMAAMSDYYLKANDGAVKKMLTTLSLVAIFILLLAIINFVNINIGTASYRLKEIGLRKVFGGAKLQLIVQHIAESFVLTLAAAVISLLVYELIRPFFGRLLNTEFDPFWQWSFYKILFLLALVTVVGFISGIYPAFVLSSGNIVNAVKGKITSSKRGLILKKVLLIFQFTMAIDVFIFALNVSKQVSYIFSKDLGYTKDQVMVVSSLPRQWDSAGVLKMENIKTQLLQIPGVKNLSLSYDIPDGNSGGFVNIYAPGKGNKPINMQLISADEDFAKVYDIKAIDGIFLKHKEDPYETGQVVLSETAVKSLGLVSPVGKNIKIGATDGTSLKIVGITKDFQNESIQKQIQPIIVANLNEPFTRSYRYFSIKLNKANINQTINAIQKQWKTLFPDVGFDYSFMDEKFKFIYQSEMQLQNATDIATSLNLIVVFMGIFGVLAFTLAKRTKEIAVRKVLGAGSKNIILLFVREYAMLILIANVIAWPIAYFVVERWLENYAYRIGQSVIPYVLVAIFVFASSFILIALQSFKVASANPVRNLRSE
ncbi:MAG: ABC transporter permease [Bacteroidetes bacterium]|nr:ABC transporter permease [Bacteroidota bacterium]